MLCLEVWYLTVLVVLTGLLDDAKVVVGSVSICMNLHCWEAMLFIGLNATISVRVSNKLGSDRLRAAKHAVASVVAQSLAMWLVAIAMVLAYRNSFVVLFTGDRDMQAATMVLNSVQSVIPGVAIGGGWQALVAYINLGCYYAFGLPLGFCLSCLLRLGAREIWVGMLCVTVLQTAVLLLVIWRTDWEAEAALAKERISVWSGECCQVKDKGETCSGDDSKDNEALAFRV